MIVITNFILIVNLTVNKVNTINLIRYIIAFLEKQKLTEHQKYFDILFLFFDIIYKTFNSYFLVFRVITVVLKIHRVELIFHLTKTLLITA